MRHSLFTIAFFLFLGGVNAQNYVVTSITGEVMYEGEKGVKTEVKLRQKLSPQQILSLSYKAQIELLEEKNKKKYILKVPGRGALGEMLKDRGNTVLQLTEDYLAYMKTRLKGKGELTSKRHSDPATVTREITVKQQTEIEKFFSYRQKSKAEYAWVRKKAIND